ncbi:RagB/SusD family nutrient uptake outer membrane protein [Gaoshiqia sp. Z1-71]|uniref:RagB/SusD family nutrient uptake outer membrane protein n=1 Tax=Gaoshiqia hydrogeniformans TaxID=3290090 RepID=UPI003BF8C2C9
MTINQSTIKVLLLALFVCAVACTENYEEYNTNPYNVTKEQMKADGYNVSAALVGLQGWVLPTNTNTFQFTDCLLGGSYGGYLADSNSGFNAGKFSTYNPQLTWNKVPFNDIIPKIFTNLTQVKSVTDDPVPLAIAMIIKVASIVRITDIYGPIPYSKVGEDGSLTAPYDSQENVYNKMFDELNQAIETLTVHKTEAISPNADKVFSGNLIKWIKFANSMKLRMAMRIVYANPTLSQTVSEDVVAHEVGPMSANSDNAYMTVTKTPFRVICYEYNGGDSRISADITSYMNGYNDPRRSFYFTQSTFQNGATNGFVGLRNGIQIPANTIAQAYSNMNITSEESKILWMNAAETAFLKAEGALRGWAMGGSAETFYNEGIELSFEQWGASGASSYMENSTNTPGAYVDPMGSFTYSGSPSTITVKWNNSSTTEQNLERIITQKWIANFPLGLEAWAEFRRTGYPKLMPAVVNNSGGDVTDNEMARRLTYPTSEYEENRANVNAALGLLGGADKMSTHVWWDCKN